MVNLTPEQQAKVDNCANAIHKLVYPYDLTITGDKDIINKTDNESAVITAILSEDNVPVVDELLYFAIVDQNRNILDSGVLVTNNNGEVDVEYTAQGAGDVKVIFSLRSILQKTYKIYDCDIQFETQDITMKYHDGTKFIANVYENGELVTKTDIDYSVGTATYTGTLLFTILQTGASYCRLFNNNNSGVALNLNMQVGEYDIITTYKTHDKEYTVTNHISIII